MDNSINDEHNDNNLNKFDQLEEQKVKGTSDFIKLLEKEIQKEKVNNNQNNSNSKPKTFLKKGEKSLNYKNRFVKSNDKKESNIKEDKPNNKKENNNTNIN